MNPIFFDAKFLTYFGIFSLASIVICICLNPRVSARIKATYDSFMERILKDIYWKKHWKKEVKSLESAIELFKLFKIKDTEGKLRPIEHLDEAKRKLQRALSELRKFNQVSIQELAKRMGVSEEYIGRLENGQISPTQEQLEVIKNFILIQGKSKA